jgi:PAS domain S-box-containing protein
VSAAWNALPDALLTFDTEQRATFVNQAARHLLAANDLSPDGADLWDSLVIYEPESQNRIALKDFPVVRALAGEKIDREEFAVRQIRQGSCWWIECSAEPLRGPDGNVEGALLIAREITGRKQREFRLNATSELRDFLYASNLAGIVHSTIDGRILDCNEAAAQMLYYSSAELRTMRTPQLYWNPADRERILHILNAKHEIRETEIGLRRRDGSFCWGLVNIRLLDPHPGQIGGTLLTTVIDITGRKTSEDTLRRSQERFEAFMRYLPGVAFIKDLAGRYVYYNEASVAQFGKSPKEIVGKRDDELWPSEHAAQYHANDETVIEAGKPIEFVEAVAHTDGSHTWQIYKFPIMENGKVVMVGGIGIDVSERRTLEEQLSQSRKMEALGRLAGGVAHDFNNLLTVICGYGQLALETAGSAPVDRMSDYLFQILNSARRASALTGQLLAFSRRQTVQPKVLDLGLLLDNMKLLLERMIGEHIDLSIRHGDEPCLIRADAHQMEQVMMNLAVNARDAMPLVGLLEIDCNVLPEPIDRPGLDPLQVLLEVRDNGIGMDESVKAQMFEPFFTSKDKGKGTGLGLSTVYGIVSQAGGDIDVESQPNEGTIFRLYFPLAKGVIEETPPPLNDSTPKGLETVLLVEDEPEVRRLSETVLKHLGYKVLVAQSGEEAIAVWDQKNAHIDVLLTDVIMPQMSGSDLAHRLREMNPRLKVLFMSGYTDDMLASHGVLAGETQLINKPFTAEALGRKLRSVLDA